MKDNRKVLYGLVALALLLSVVGISIGFASLSQNLEIEGTAEVVPASWDIKFKNLSAAVESGTADELSAPSLSTTSTKISGFDVQLAKPGDSVTYKFKIANDGDINAVLSDMQVATPTFTGTGDTASADEAIVAAAFEYTLEYDNGASAPSAISVNDTLNSTTERDVILTIKYKDDAESVPTAKVEITGLSIILTYTQAN